MADRETETTELPPSDIERLQIIAALIHERIAYLSTAERSEGFTDKERRELFVLVDLRDHWLREALG